MLFYAGRKYLNTARLRYLLGKVLALDAYYIVL